MKRTKSKRNSIKRNGINPQKFSVGQLKFHAYLIPIAVIMGLPILFIFMNAFMIVGIAYIYQKATRKLFIKEFEYEIYEDFFYVKGNKYEYQDVIKCEIHYFDYFFINVLCLHIDMKNTSKSPLLLYSEDLDEGIDYKDIQLFKFYESVSEHLRIS